MIHDFGLRHGTAQIWQDHFETIFYLHESGLNAKVTGVETPGWRK